MIKNNIFKSMLFLLSFLCFSVINCAPQLSRFPFTQLSKFPFNGASVLPIVQKGKDKVVILGCEVFGPDAGTWDAFGGKKESNETHPVVTAAREFAEETKGLIMNASNARTYIDTPLDNTKFVIANASKASVVYITTFDIKHFNKLFDAFYRKKASNFTQSEKSEIGYVDWNVLIKTIANAKRNSTGQLISPITIKAKVARLKNKKLVYEDKTIDLRPYFVSSLQPFCKDLINKTNNFVAGFAKVIRFY